MSVVIPSTNANYFVFQSGPEPYPKIASNEPYHLATVSLVRDMEKPFGEFTKQVEEEIASWPKTTLLGVFPEFCWRKSNPQEVFNYLSLLKTKIRPDLALVLGTLEFTLNGNYTNNAIVVYDGKLWYVPKTKVLKGDKELGIVRGNNPGVICLPRFNLGVLVCADLWDVQLCYKLVFLQKADILAVPAWTATRKSNHKYARLDWHSLARVRSTEYSVIVVVADHLKNFPNTDVANGTVGFTPADRSKDFPLPLVEREIIHIDPSEILNAVEKWAEKGLAQDPPQEVFLSTGTC